MMEFDCHFGISSFFFSQDERQVCTNVGGASGVDSMYMSVGFSHRQLLFTLLLSCYHKWFELSLFVKSFNGDSTTDKPFGHWFYDM